MVSSASCLREARDGQSTPANRSSPETTSSIEPGTIYILKVVGCKQVEPTPKARVTDEGLSVRDFASNRVFLLAASAWIALGLAGCQQKSEAPAGAGGMQAMPVQTMAVSIQPVPDGSEYVSTIKSRRSATLQPQVDGRLTQIGVRSGDRVQSGQVLMEIDPLHETAAVASAKATERQKKAVYDFNSTEIERQKKLFDAGVTSRDVYDQAQQAFDNAKADYEAAVETRKTDEEQLAYYTIRAPFDGIVGDIPVHVGDYVSPSTMLTTVDERRDLEAYI